MIILAGFLFGAGLYALTGGSVLGLILWPFRVWAAFLLYSIVVIFVLPWLLLALCFFSN